MSGAGGNGALFGAKRAAARAVGAASRASGRGGGTTLPGRVLLRLEPDAIARLGSGLEGRVTIVSATNGKTTTAGMIAALLADAGREPVHNRAGSNMTWGVATALLEQRGEEGLFEVDEAWLPKVSSALNPSLLVLGNLFRDQLDRYGEIEVLADRWAELVASREGATRFVLNADDPLVADLGRDDEEQRREGVVYFGIDDPSQALPEMQHASDAKHCRRCGHPYAYERAFVGHLGHYSCPNCGAERPRPDLAATSIELRGMEGSTFTARLPDGGELTLRLPLPGLYNVYNALASLAAGLELGVGANAIGASLAEVRAAFGRVETIQAAGVPLSILLIKNPAGANEVLRTLRLEAAERPLDLWIALNDRIADGRDVSWVWDADFELLGNDVRRVTCAGTRASEMALRLKYAGWPEEKIAVDPEIDSSLDTALAAAPERLFALPTYTALLELRKLLTARGLAKDFSAMTAAAAVIWHDVECGGYDGDLSLWRELVAAAEGPVLDLGCGTGRVALDLARRGHEMRGLDLDPDLVAAFNERAATTGLPASARAGDAREFELEERFSLVLAPMQLLQVLDGAGERLACLRAARRHLLPGGRVAAAIVDGMPPELVEEAPPPLPDTREAGGWLYSSLPLDATLDEDTIVVRRLRQKVSPEGTLSDELDEIPLRLLSTETVEAEAAEAGLATVARHDVPPTDSHVGSVVLVLAEAA